MILAVVTSGVLSTLIVAMLNRRKVKAESVDIITHASETALNMVAGQLERAERRIVHLTSELERALSQLSLTRAELHDALARIRVLERELRKTLNK